MAATLAELVTLAHGRNDLHFRVAGACLKAAWGIYYEDVGTANHAERLVWAKRVLASKEGMIEVATEMFLFFLSNATIQTVGAAATDNDIEFVVNSLIDTMAVQ